MKSNAKSKTVKSTDGRPTKVLQPELRFDFGPKDPAQAILDLVRKEHLGASAAISIEQIAEKLWYSEWWYARLDGKQRSYYPHREPIQRLVKKACLQLKREHKPWFGVCRGSKNDPPGYFWIQNDTELVTSLFPYASQGVSMIETIAEITKDREGWFIPELRARLKALKEAKLDPPITQIPQIEG